MAKLRLASHKGIHFAHCSGCSSYNLGLTYLSFFLRLDASLILVSEIKISVWQRQNFIKKEGML